MAGIKPRARHGRWRDAAAPPPVATSSVIKNGQGRSSTQDEGRLAETETAVAATMGMTAWLITPKTLRVQRSFTDH